MEINYLISVIIPIYNASDEIDGIMKTLMRQTIGFDSLEVIFVDDKSKDDSYEKMQELASTNSNIVVAQCTENSGFAGRPRNIGLKMASAKYIMFMDQDDRYYENACEVLYEKIESEDVDIVSGYHSEHDEHGNLTNEKILQFREYDDFIINSIDEKPSILKLYFVWNKIYKKSAILENNISFVENIPNEDVVFFTDLAMVMKGFCYINKPIIAYSLRISKNSSLTYQINERNAKAIGHGFTLACEKLDQADRANLYPYLAFMTVEFYYTMIVDNVELPFEETKNCLEGLAIIFKKAVEFNLIDDSLEIEAICELVALDRCDLAAKMIQIKKDATAREVEFLEEIAAEKWKYDKLVCRLDNMKAIRFMKKYRGWEIEEDGTN